MINRTLIRQKVVQILYAHRIARTDFKIITGPERDTREAIDAFCIYKNVITVLLLITAQRSAFQKYPALRRFVLENTIDIRGNLLQDLAEDPEVGLLISALENQEQGLIKIIRAILPQLEKSVILKDFCKKHNVSVEDEIKFWEAVIDTIIMPQIRRYYVDTEPEISDYAFKQGCRLACDTIKAYGTTRVNFITALNELDDSLQEAYHLYIALLSLPVELTNERKEQIEKAKNKYIPTAEELNPNTRFVDNKLVEALATNNEIKKYLEKNPVYWGDEPAFLRTLLNEIMQSDIYARYMERESVDYSKDCEFWCKILEKIVFPSDQLVASMENKNIYWNDDLAIVGGFVIKTLQRSIKSQSGEKEPTLSNQTPTIDIAKMYRDSDDEKFGAKLFKDSWNNFNTYREYIDKFLTKDWDIERIAFMDVIIVVVAISEMINFPLIPLPVTMNEYTDIASDYSTERSGNFVNGIMSSVAKQLKKEGKIMK